MREAIGGTLLIHPLDAIDGERTSRSAASFTFRARISGDDEGEKRIELFERRGRRPSISTHPIVLLRVLLDFRDII